jgi:hypothetical protein
VGRAFNRPEAQRIDARHVNHPQFPLKSRPGDIAGSFDINGAGQLQTRPTDLHLRRGVYHGVNPVGRCCHRAGIAYISLRPLDFQPAQRSRVAGRARQNPYGVPLVEQRANDVVSHESSYAGHEHAHRRHTQFLKRCPAPHNKDGLQPNETKIE